MFYAIFRELFSGHSPNVIYGKALKRCKEDARIIDACGEPIKGYGETTARGRRRHVSHLEYVKDGLNYMRMKFYIEGNRRKGVVHLEMKENANGKYDYRYLFVELEGYPQQTIILEDNRHIF
ncbi:mitochondrial import inner membrane translocase subunit Tim21 [Centruroides vittatus]